MVAMIWYYWIEGNVKKALKLTIDELHINCPKKVSKNSIKESLKCIIKKDKEFLAFRWNIRENNWKDIFRI